MSRVAWRSLMQRHNFEFAHTASGRPHMDHAMRAVVGWAVCGGEDFVRAAVPAMRTAGMEVTALSVTPASFHNVEARLRAQDSQDTLCAALNVPCGLSVEAIAAQDDFSHVLVAACESTVQALNRSGKTILQTPRLSMEPAAGLIADYLQRMQRVGHVAAQ